MVNSFGARARTRNLFKRDFRRHGRAPLSTLLAVYKKGDFVDVKVDSSVHKGMPYKYYHGRTGVIWNVTPRAVGVIVAKRVRTRIIHKKISVRIEHVRKSQCQTEFKARVAHNERVKKTKIGKRIKRKPAQPLLQKTISGKTTKLGPKKFIFSEVYDY
eukprot:NODE_2018_length_669_cov_926.633871_g1578_i0.p1 GENE.NODE_2018_length_669_cov_926.633871_g1578_i0~~NODE_2018_length_669_cov_926.633871_g1578_i0.p1  ORF type:complete len:158 (+),score=25.39 NODE_2018_length_669_cov_926.633871_g1578_i0:81-554(+)